MPSRHGRADRHGECTATPLAIVKPRTWLSCKKTFVPDGKKYADYAETILKSLSGPGYLSAKGSNQGYVLMHSTGSLPHGSEIDVPLNYADYYYLEAMKRYMDRHQ